MMPVNVTRGSGPIILGMPHVGTGIPVALSGRLNDTGRAVADTDWWIDRLYDGLLDDVTVVQARYSRYVIDANRDPSGLSLYPGQNTTGVCPTTTFDGADIYRIGEQPDDDEIAERIRDFHEPYHAALEEQIDRVKDRHGLAILYDCHSIRSDIPHLFDGRLPVFNIGTNGGQTCAPAIEQAVIAGCSGGEDFDCVVNGRFRGGWTTRRYGCPVQNVHAIQLEMAQRAYMDETPPWTYRPDRADRVRRRLRHILKRLEEIALQGIC